MVNEILKIIPTMQSIELVGDHLNKKKKKKKGFIESATHDIVGISLINETSNFLK